MELNLADSILLGEQLRDPNPNIPSQRQSALAFVEHLFAKYPDDPCVIALRARHDRMVGDFNQAKTRVSRGLELYPDHPLLLRLKYNLQRELQEHRAAEQTLLQLFLNDEVAGQISSYLRESTNARVVLGPGEHFYPDWLNLDLCPYDARFIPFDARDALLLPSESMEIVFSEHMIEHITYAQGVFLVGEIFRVSKPGGRIRLATPDLARTCSLAIKDLDTTQQRYIDFINQSFGGDHNNRASFVINNMFFTYSHAFVYDEITLRELLERVGFVDIVRHMPRSSPHPELNQLEKHHLLGHPWVEDFQTLVLEARKP